jgi:hypothetical protein
MSGNVRSGANPEGQGRAKFEFERRYIVTVRNYRKFADLPINNKQKTVIKMAVKALGISDDDYRDGLEKRFGVRSCTKLTFTEATVYIKELEDKGFTIVPGKGVAKPVKAAPPRGTRPPISRSDTKLVGLATRGELEKVDQVAALIEWRVEGGLELFLEKRMKIKGGRVRTSGEAYLAIEGLKKMFENSMKKQHGAAWWTGTYTDAIDEYIRLHAPAEWR